MGNWAWPHPVPSAAGGRRDAGRWVAFLCSSCSHPDQDPSARSFLLLPPEGLQVPSPRGHPPLQRVFQHLLTSLFPFGVSLTPLGVWGSLALSPSPPWEAPLREDGEGEARIPQPARRGKGAPWGRPGKAWPDPRTLLLPGTFQSLSASPPAWPPSRSEALGLFGETPPPTLPLPGNSCGWMRGWEPGRHGGGVRRREGEREEGGGSGCAQGVWRIERSSTRGPRSGAGK